MADFKTALLITLSAEQYWTTLDGGTYAGIVRKLHPDWQGWYLIDKYVKKLGRPLHYNERVKDRNLQPLISQFYRVNYWRKIRGDEIENQDIADMLFDWTVTSWDDAIKALQTILKVVVDGDLGKQTLKALNEGDAKEIYKSLYDDRIEFYQHVDIKYAPAWMRRVKDNFPEAA